MLDGAVRGRPAEDETTPPPLPRPDFPSPLRAGARGGGPRFCISRRGPPPGTSRQRQAFAATRHPPRKGEGALRRAPRSIATAGSPTKGHKRGRGIRLRLLHPNRFIRGDRRRASPSADPRVAASRLFCPTGEFALYSTPFRPYL